MKMTRQIITSWIIGNLKGDGINLGRERGSALITIIVAITVAAGLGGGIYSFTSTSSLSQVGSMNATKAYYLAEAGGQYGIKRLANIDSADSTARNNLMAELTASDYQVNGAGKFALSVTYTAQNGFHIYRLTSEGKAVSSVSRTVNYDISVGNSAGLNIPFDADPGNHDALNPDNWNTVGKAKLDGSKLKLNDGDGNTQVSFDWSNQDSTLPDLSEIWARYGYLSYEVQLKVKLSTDNDIMSGISFRLDTNGNSDIADDSFYGLSYLWCKDGHDLPYMCGSVSDKTYIVLWRQAVDGTQTIIHKTEAASVLGGLVDGNKLKDNSTLIVRVLEQNNPSTGTRENLIYSFVADKDTYSKGTINWDYGSAPTPNFIAVPWGTSCAIDNACFGVDGSYFVVDQNLTTENFTTSIDEIGIHAFGNEKTEIRDMAIRFNFSNNQTVTY